MDKLHSTVELIEKLTKAEDISEEAMRQLLENIKVVADEVSRQKNLIDLLNRTPRLDLINLLFKEGIEDLEEQGVEAPYIDLAYEQFRKLRNPCD